MHLENLESTKIYKGKIKQYLSTILPLKATIITISQGFSLCQCVYNLFFRILGSYYLISVGSYFLKLIHINISCILKKYLKAYYSILWNATITQSSIIFAIFLHYN